jgi:hypothetical protein
MKNLSLVQKSSMPRIVFPDHWRAGANVHTDAATEEAIAWMKAHGMGCTPEEEDLLQKFCCGHFSGYAVPYTNYGRYLIITEFLTLWLFWDDYEVETAERAATGELYAAITGERLPAGASRYITAWYELGRRLRLTQSRDWSARLGKTMHQWLAVSRIETERAREQQRSGRSMDLEGYLGRRVISIGMYPMFHLLEYTEGCELGALHAHPVVKALELLASRLVALDNDLLSLGKDMAHAWPNAVTVLSAHQGLPMREAFARVVAMHRRDVARFDELAEDLIDEMREDERKNESLRRWVQAVRYAVHGFAVWESMASRYRQYRAVVDGEALATQIAYERAAEPDPGQDAALAGIPSRSVWPIAA